MEIVKIFLVLAVILVSSGVQAKEKRELSLRVNQVPPMYYKNNKGEWTGRDFSITKKVITNAGYQIKLNILPFKRSLVELKAGRLDIMMALTPNQERSEHFLWIGPYDYEEIALIVKEEDKNLSIHSAKDLISIVVQSKEKIGIQTGFIFFDPEFINLANNAEHILAVPRQETRGRMLQKDRLFGFFGQRALMEYQISNGLEHMKGLVAHSFTLRKAPNYLGISKKIDPTIYEELVSSFEELEGTNAFEEIKRTKWKK